MGQQPRELFVSLDAELGEHPVEVTLDGADRDIEPVRDLAIGRIMSIRTVDSLGTRAD
jgi:hypothetical protein